MKLKKVNFNTLKNGDCFYQYRGEASCSCDMRRKIVGKKVKWADGETMVIPETREIWESQIVYIEE